MRSRRGKKERRNAKRQDCSSGLCLSDMQDAIESGVLTWKGHGPAWWFWNQSIVLHKTFEEAFMTVWDPKRALTTQRTPVSILVVEEDPLKTVHVVGLTATRSEINSLRAESRKRTQCRITGPTPDDDFHWYELTTKPLLSYVQWLQFRRFLGMPLEMLFMIYQYYWSPVLLSWTILR